ncbi:MAG: branched-chain amino acid aminotransferase [Propionibacteriaceae bacterium]|jgi:branched-chain amino acid aminotransferase|nr:branched-chain amino acid aminotransferase [Propionibacteriaceae bacterium]
MALKYPLTPNPAPKTAEQIAEIHRDPGFGVHFTDHMSIATWKKGAGWADDALVPYGPFQMSPAAAVLHYGQEIFEGMKAYRWEDGSIWVFRPEENARRFNRSALRIVLPEIPEEDFIAAVDRLVAQDAAWVPTGDGERSLYLRPFMFASEDFLGVRATTTATFCVIASPVAPYFAGGVKPVDIWVTDEYARAGIGGTGAAKCGGNYAASLLPQYQGYQHGCDQVLYIEASNKDRVEEFGGMNLFILKQGKLITPALTGTILDGITRKSAIQVAADLGIETEERRITPDELFSGVQDGTITEAFSCGTAAVVTPVNAFKDKRASYQLAQPAGRVTMSLRERLVAIQYGRAEDVHGWMRQVV